MDIKTINKRIIKEFSKSVADKESTSVIKNIEIFKNILIKNEISESKINNIINEYILNIVPAGTKGVIRGITFNEIIKQYIFDLKLNQKKYDVCFEKKCKYCITDEIPDFYIYNKLTKKLIIGMNQMDFWKGGAQMNRGFKYIFENKFATQNIKFLCVVCNKVKIKNSQNKIYKLFDCGFTNNTLCYINNLKNIIDTFFEL